MRKVIYYVTQSVDGFIADKNGGVGWLYGAPNTDYGYEEFYRSIDTVLLGSATYKTILNMSPHFPYPDKNVCVFTSDKSLEIRGERTALISEDAATYVARLKISEGGSIWLGGGGALASTLLQAGLVDQIRTFIQPMILGGGVPVFAEAPKHYTLELNDHKKWPGNLVELDYSIVKDWRSDV